MEDLLKWRKDWYLELAALAVLADRVGDTLFSNTVVNVMISASERWNECLSGTAVGIIYKHSPLPNSQIKSLIVDCYGMCESEFMAAQGALIGGGQLAADVAARYMRRRETGETTVVERPSYDKRFRYHMSGVGETLRIRETTVYEYNVGGTEKVRGRDRTAEYKPGTAPRYSKGF